MSPMRPFGGGQLDPKLMMLLQQIMPQLAGGGPGGAPALGGAGQPPLGAPPPNSVPGVTPPPPQPGGAPAFGPGGMPGGPPPDATPPPPSPQAAPGVTPPAQPSNPNTDMVNMTLGQAAFGGQERGLDRQMKLADELRTAPMPGMRGNSRVQTAANPLEFAANALDQIGGQRMSDDTEKKRNDLFEKRMRQLRQDMGGTAGNSSTAGFGTSEMGPGWGTGQL